MVLEVFPEKVRTAECLLTVLDGDDVAADLLASEVHNDVVVTNADVEKLPDLVNYTRKLHITKRSKKN